jgi:DNA-directed RNA polymerase beta' subunit
MLIHLLEKVKTDSRLGLKKFLDGKQDQVTSGDVTKEELHEMGINVAKQFSEDRQGFKVKLDGAMQQSVNKSASDVIKACIPNALQMSFLKNNFSMMVLTGAKGSAVNQSQISCFLGQQALEHLVQMAMDIRLVFFYQILFHIMLAIYLQLLVHMHNKMQLEDIQ